MLRAAPSFVIGLGIAFGAAGCVDGFRGSNIQATFSSPMPAQAGIGKTPSASQLPTNSRFTLYGIQTTATSEVLFALEQFEVHAMVDAGSPCFIDRGQTARFPGLHSSQYADKIAEVTGITDYRNPPATASENDKIDAATAEQRMRNMEALGNGLKVVTSASDVVYPPFAAACPGSDSQFPPIDCIDDQSNANRLRLCERIWNENPNLWEGTDRVLTAPLNGTTMGMVDGVNPINLAPIGGVSSSSTRPCRPSTRTRSTTGPIPVSIPASCCSTAPRRTRRAASRT